MTLANGPFMFLFFVVCAGSKHASRIASGFAIFAVVVAVLVGPQNLASVFSSSSRVNLHFSSVVEPITARIKSGDFELLKKVLNTIAKVTHSAHSRTRTPTSVEIIVFLFPMFPLVQVAPEHRPILVVREVVNMTAGQEAQAFARLFATLESAKQETRAGKASLLFPVFLETSDFAWSDTA